MHNPQLGLRKFLAQFFDQRQRRLVRVAHAEQHFIFGIVEQAMAAKSSIHVGIESLERPEDADGRGKTGFAEVGYFALEAPGRHNAHHEIRRASHRQQIAQHGNGSERRMHGERCQISRVQPITDVGEPVSGCHLGNCHYERPSLGARNLLFGRKRKKAGPSVAKSPPRDDNSAKSEGIA